VSPGPRDLPTVHHPPNGPARRDPNAPLDPAELVDGLALALLDPATEAAAAGAAAYMERLCGDDRLLHASVLWRLVAGWHARNAMEAGHPPGVAGEALFHSSNMACQALGFLMARARQASAERERESGDSRPRSRAADRLARPG
jgi:hypothetical protein